MPLTVRPAGRSRAAAGASWQTRPGDARSFSAGLTMGYFREKVKEDGEAQACFHDALERDESSEVGARLHSAPEHCPHSEYYLSG